MSTIMVFSSSAQIFRNHFRHAVVSAVALSVKLLGWDS